MNWNYLEKHEQLQQLAMESNEQYVLIFKHSTTCSTSRMSLDRLQRNWNADEMKEVKPYFLDLLSYREISNAIAATFGIHHESPQVIVIKNGKPVFNCSHFEIDYKQIKKAVKN
jgi:bacillithiol system protein YtxJ